MQAAKEARSRGASDEGAADFATWKLPPEGWFKVNTDGARNSSNGMACCGGVIRDDEGRWRFGFAKFIGIYSVLEAELWGMYLGLSYAWARGFRKVILEVDSTDAVLAVNKRHKGFTRLPILNQIPALIDKAWEVQVCRVPRRVNRAADGMAKVARFDSLECDGFEVPPAVTIALLRLDALEA
ncbi:hypothetical protein V6N12_001266 [Hibiscus sabdariffa]|uniref:RNase H type-1 domain-containing protein n=1 Tax=Hibiscus sabdariffa TaxID=183260 RepID=A0ABR2C6R2_9ROSI